MPRIIYFNGSLGITSFDVQVEGKPGDWSKATFFEAGKRYRFAVRVLNNAGDPAAIDLTNLRVIDLFNPLNLFRPFHAPALPHGENIAYAKIKVVTCPLPGGFNAYRFYRDSSYAGPWQPVGDAEFNEILVRGKDAHLYIYFKWDAGPVKISPSLPGQYVPQVKMKAKELKICALPEGPLANLQPNT
jgi:hypothetical protein